VPSALAEEHSTVQVWVVSSMLSSSTSAVRPAKALGILAGRTSRRPPGDGHDA